MYRKDNSHQLELENFYIPFSGHLRSDNRWIILAGQIPWQEIEEAYGELFSEDNGCPALSARIALGALLIKKRLGISDRETVEQIRENPYLQYFLGLMEYQDKQLFDNSMMTHFRKRFDKEILNDINEKIVEAAMKDTANNDVDSSDCKKDTSDKDGDEPPSNEGKLITDATCTPADITYPTDLSLLNKAREKSEEIIDTMHKLFTGVRRKPRTYRQKAHKAYLVVAKQKKPGARKIRKAIGQQLKAQRKLQRQDELDRIQWGKFGQDKRRFSLARVMTKLAQTSEVLIIVSFIVMNLEKILTGILSFLLFIWRRLLARLKSSDHNCRSYHIGAV